MRPSLRQMQYVITVHDLGNFSLAAEALHVSQPSLSAQIKAVEDDLGLPLFIRSKSGARPTGAGIEFVTRARLILSEVDKLRGALRSDAPFGGRLRLGVLPSIGPYLLPQVMHKLHQSHSNLRVILREENTSSLDEGLRTGRFDVILSTPEDHANTKSIPLFHETLWVALPTDHPLAAKSEIQAHDLAGERLLTLDHGHRLTRVVYGIAGISGCIVSDDYEGTSLESLVLMAATGAGLAILPQLFMQSRPRPEVALRPLMLADASRLIALMIPAQDTIRPGHDMLVDILRQTATSLALSIAGSSTNGG